MFTNANNKLSLAASAVWQARFPEFEDMPDYSGDCGDLIAEGNRRHLLRIVKEAGYATPGEYNKELRVRLLGVGREDGLGHMSHRVYELLSGLEVDDVCPRCDNALDVFHGPELTFYNCENCGFSDC